MSLINKVLKDLERRHASGEHTNLDGLSVRELPAFPGTSFGRKISFVGLLAVAILGGLIASTDLPRFAHPTAALPSSIEPAKVPEAKLPPLAAAAPFTAPAVPAIAVGEEASTASSEPRVNYELRSSVLDMTAVVLSEKPAVVAHMSPRARAQPAVLSEPPETRTSADARRDEVQSSPPPIEKNVREPTARERAHAALESGLMALRRKANAEAEQLFLASIAADSSFDRGRQALLSLLLDAQNKPMAEAVALDGVAHGGAKASFAMISARLKLERGAAKDALSLLVQERATGASNPDYLALWGNALAREQRHVESAQKYSEAIALAPKNPGYHIGLGYALRNDSQYAAAYTAFQSVSEMEGISPPLANLAQQQLQSLQRVLGAPKK